MVHTYERSRCFQKLMQQLVRHLLAEHKMCAPSLKLFRFDYMDCFVSHKNKLLQCHPTRMQLSCIHHVTKPPAT